jgi:apolipoprotein N-acyltransferase
MVYLSKKQRYLLSFLSGVLMTLSFPFTGSLTPLVFIAWIPLLLTERVILSNNYKTSNVFIHAYITFFSYNLGTTWWIWNASAGGAIMAFVLNALLMALAFYFSSLIKKRLGKKWEILVLLSCWLAFEFLHYHWELSWPWLTVGNVFSIHPEWVQWYSVTGVLGGSMWVLLINIIGFRLIVKQFFSKKKPKIWKESVGLLGLIVVPIVLSWVQYCNYTETKNPLEVLVLQPNIDPYTEKFTEVPEKQLKKMCDLVDKRITSSTSIILAPETALSWTFYESDLPLLPFFSYLKDRKRNWHNASFYTGASTYRFFERKHSSASHKMEGGPGYYESYNSSLLLDEQNNYSFLHKSKLVLGVEKIPFSRWLPFLEELSIKNGGTSGTLGIETSPKVMRTQALCYAPLICYESVYGAFNAEQCRKGAEVIFVITNDGWWKDTPGYKQHASFARLRAIENRRSVARSANTGTSCFINQRGDVVQASRWWTATALVQRMNKNDELTIYTKIGDALGRYASVLSGLLVILALSRRVKRQLR